MSNPAKTRRPSRPAPKPGERRPVLISLHRQWTEKMLTGEKTVELRRTRCGCEPGTPVVIYTSHPVKRIQARAVVKAVHAMTPDALWAVVARQCAVTRAGFFEYLGDLDTAYGIELTAIEPLNSFELGRPGPQSWRYLFADEEEGLRVLSLAGLA